MINQHLRASADGPSAWTTLETADGPMRLYLARPQRPADRAVIVLQEAFGVNEYIQETARRYAARGYLAVAPDLFHRTGVQTLAYEQHAEAMPLIGAIGPAAIAMDLEAVLAYLTQYEDTAVARTAVHGFCFGGRAAFTAAVALDGLAATIVFYGPGIAVGPHAVVERAAQIDAPLQMHVGSADPTIPSDQVAAIDAALRAAEIEFESYVYEGAGHAFACDARPHMYDTDAAELAWDRSFAFLDKHLPASE
jgi:carboxymethylenebutenolidase